MYATDYFETMILNTLRGTNAAAPASMFVGLYLSNPGETGMAGTEVTYSGYQRQAITFSNPAPISGNIGIQNDTEIKFAMTATALQPITHIGISDSVSGGNMLLYGQYDEPLQIPANGSPVIRVGDAQWWCVGSFSNMFKTSVFNILRGTSLPGFQSFCALYNGSPESGGIEISGTGYARMLITFSAPAQQVSGQAQISNSIDIEFPKALTNWGTFTHMAVFNASSSGQPVAYVDNGIGAYNIVRGIGIIYSAGDLSVYVH